MIRGRGWKYIRYANGREYLYNLRQDPGEMANLIDEPEHSTARQMLAGEMDKWLNRTGWPA
jgi:arylsulfatase A-like enzyme